MPNGNMDDVKKSYRKEWVNYLYAKGLPYNKMLKVIGRKNTYALPPK